MFLEIVSGNRVRGKAVYVFVSATPVIRMPAPATR